ncbi:hypothetical protein F4859DRAFT_517957 [Xylaria cf. heliscus]|nr:hypothetical protein F4859DRAFT_517957 [Xylaria cf. heliscus]
MMRGPRDMTEFSQAELVRQENKEQACSSSICTKDTASIDTYNVALSAQTNQQAFNIIHHQLNQPFGDTAGRLPFPSQRTELQIIQIGEGTTVAGQSTEDFASRPRVSLCYQCCKRIPLYTLVSTREQSCGNKYCRRTQEAGLEFIMMPKGAADACDEFQAILIWWMDKLDLGADEVIGRRSQNRVQEMRDNILDVNS